MNKLRAMYSAEMSAAAAPPPAQAEAPPPPQMTLPVRQRSPSAPPLSSAYARLDDGATGTLWPPPSGAGELADDWEDEVDDLLDWTSGLPAGME